MNLRLLCLIFALVVIGAGSIAGGGAGASVQAAGLTQPVLETWSANPSLGARARTQVVVGLPSTAAEVGKLTLYVPAGYAFDPSDPPGTHEGHVFMATTSDFADGDLTAVNPVAYVNTPQAQACAPGGHAGVWIMDFSAGLFSSQAVTVPLYIDPTSPDEASLGSYKLQACLPLAKIASPGGWPLGSRVRGLSMELTRLTNPTSMGLYVWRAFVDNPDANGNPDPATAYELRADTPLPAKLTMTRRYVRRHHRALLAGQLMMPASPVAGIPIGLYRRDSDGFWHRVASTRTLANGSYRFRPVTKSGTYGAEAWTTGDCNGDSTAPNGCLSESLAAVDSPNVRVVVPRHR
jgi:hypothetical protein